MGHFEQAGQGVIKKLQQEFRNNLGSIENACNPDIIIGLSYHNIENGFSYYLALEVPNLDVIPQGMTGISVPAHTSATSQYEEENVHEVYSEVYNWIELNKYVLDQNELEHYEEFPFDYNPMTDSPKLKLHIPIQKK
ncbi:putative transcriptional regulator YdeE [Bacillus mesophilus]|uniref:Transcriptional regulator n=1 Tax=Bacillus mesophilus TaxID=1808955 RepID=A0A6M0Q5N9_9BACI|nr:putative transcriptional regulator YdeE [Bacillus mesophilus]NEY70800.1 transcriptional regulator [Bacillus mesophilus]